MAEIVTTIIFGSFGIFALASYFTRRWVEKKIERAENAARERREQARARYRLNDTYMHCVGRVLFWLVHGAKKSDPTHAYYNGELQSAFDSLVRCENDLKELDRQQLAEINEE